MDKIIEKYLDGDKLAEDLLLDDMVEEYDYNITIQEAKLLLIKKYGKPEIFW